MVIRDLGLVAKNILFLYNSAKASESTDPEFRKQFSELLAIAKTNKLLFSQISKVLFGNRKDSPELIINPCKNRDHWFFINGITTTKEVATVNQLALNTIFDNNFSVLYNPTHGIIADILECIQERTFNQYSNITIQLYDKIQESMGCGNKIKIIGHSQGGIIVSNLLKLFRDSGKKYPNLEVYTFASAADEDIQVSGVYQEHFVNENDFVARIGMLHFNRSSQMYMIKDYNGHLLNRDHLEHFKQGKYCNGKSRLFNYVKRKG
jgi:hypothetical protein